MRARLEGTDGFEKKSKDKDALKLLHNINHLMFCSDAVKWLVYVL